jgi:hypothetical protein
MEELMEPRWRKSSYSGNGGANCVEVGTGLPSKVAIRDTKNVPGPVLVVSGHAWAKFTEAVKLGEFAL